MIRIRKTFLLGVAVGALAAWMLAKVIQVLTPAPVREVLAKVDDEVLKEKDLRQKMAPQLIPIENDEYVVLEQGVTDWLNTQLIAREARRQGMSSEELYRREIWSQVRVSYQNIFDYYNRTRELYGNQPFDAISSLIGGQLRASEYVRVKEEYLGKLKRKYDAKIFLKKPPSFVEHLALPTVTGPVVGIPPSPVPEPPAALPAEPTKPVEKKSEPDTAPSQGPATAPITVVEFSDFHCPFCKKMTLTLEQLFESYPGKIHWVFRHFPLSMHPGSDRTHEASACAHEQGKFWKFHDAIFSLPEAPQEADLQTAAKKIGLDLSKFQECFQSRRYQKLVQEDVNNGSQRGVQGTPTVFVNDQVIGGAYPYEYFVQVVEGILNPGKALAAPPTPAPSPAAPAPPLVVRFDDLEGRPSLGPKEAPVTLVEFSDFECPFCKRVTPTLEQLMKNYPGKVRRVWRHYPLSFHTGSDRAHEASECAQEQSKFWEYHDKLFEAQGKPWDDRALVNLAGQTGVNKKKFEKCLTSGKYKDLIQKEISKGNQVGVQGTPAIFINGKLVSGAQPYENFDQIVKQELAKS